MERRENAEQKRLCQALEELRKAMGRKDFMELAAMFLQKSKRYLFMDSKHSESGGTAYYMCKNTEYSDSVCLAVVTTEDLGREKLDLSGIGTEFQKKIDILSYDNKNDVYLLLLWCYREKDKFFENRYKKLADEMKQKLSFLDEKPLAWWVREGII